MILAGLLSLAVGACAQTAPPADAPVRTVPREAVSIPTGPPRGLPPGGLAPRRPGEPAKSLQDAQKKIGDIKAASFDGGLDEPEKDGVETRLEASGGGLRAGGRRVPAVGASGHVEAKKGAWEAEADGEGTWARGMNGGVLGNYSLEAGVSRQLPGSKAKVILEGELERDEFLGVSGARALRAGVEAPVIDHGKHELDVAVGVGPNREAHMGGEVERFISPAVALEYTLKLTSQLKLGERLEGEFNAKDRSDIEFKSVTDAVWTLSSKWALRLSHTFKMRTQAIDGHPGERAYTLLGVVLNP